MAVALASLQTDAPLADSERHAQLLHRFNLDRADLERALEVGGKLNAVLESLRCKANDLEAQNARSRPEPWQQDARVTELECQVDSEQSSLDAVEARLQSLRKLVEQRQRQHNVLEHRVRELSESAQTLQTQSSVLTAAHLNATSRAVDMEQKLRSMVSIDVVHRIDSEESLLRSEIAEAESDATRCRNDIADAWAKRSCEPEFAPEAGTRLSVLDDVQEQVQIMANMQQAAWAETHHVQHLERQQVALEKKIRQAAQENADLKSIRLDLGDSANSMRQAIAHQNAAAAERINPLVEVRKQSDMDRQRLLLEIAGLQERVTEVAPVLRRSVETDCRREELAQSQQRLEGESKRLHTINGALGAKLMSEDDTGGFDSMPENIARVLTLNRRLRKTHEIHNTERQKLLAQIRSLDPEFSGDIPEDLGRQSEEARKLNGGSLLANTAVVGVAKEAWRGGIAKLRTLM